MQGLSIGVDIPWVRIGVNRPFDVSDSPPCEVSSFFSLLTSSAGFSSLSSPAFSSSFFLKTTFPRQCQAQQLKARAESQLTVRAQLSPSARFYYLLSPRLVQLQLSTESEQSENLVMITSRAASKCRAFLARLATKACG